MSYHRQVIEEILSGRVRTRSELERLKIELCKGSGLSHIPTNAEILEKATPEERARLLPFLRIKPMRTLSGVAVVATMTSPADCPHGKCSYCPGGVPSNTPQSYTGREPAALRASHNAYDPYRQTKARLEQLAAIGHPTDKVDLIIMGGTFTSRTAEYREGFVKGCLDAMNGAISDDLESAKTLNESAPSRCIGLTIETRPDRFSPAEAVDSLRVGATRLEFGVQTLNDSTLKAVERGHGVKETTEATKTAKDAGLKVGYHMMPGLPGETRDSDLATFRTLFSDERFMPDMLKIYPTLVMPGTKLHAAWERGEYKPYSVEEVVELLADFKAHVPPWLRIQRIQRDIPAQLIADGVRKSHVRVLVREELRRRGGRCRCIRCREVGHALAVEGEPDAGDAVLNTIEYKASGGREVFISFDEPGRGALVAYLRLRLTTEGAHAAALGGQRRNSSDALGSSAAAEPLGIVREVKVFGQMLPISSEPKSEWQHRGLGGRLLAEAEEISRAAGARRMLVTSGVGARGYYRRLGYALSGEHMGKRL
ncbi:MAG: tRNA uridine(34) 5-carboxymethylaminomethyl modification radical SAM/GNAT enzyme Elp3 [Euryarchaeota archaeon]|nr:tRNA uridine(34) 5-carboxymethylaminomethyl modification radical SAM/GNAT enzyme Elp3 [Euryarchaeota archaeon]